ncbi:MAG: winged helix-turn-helix domain-containing protein, partial [Acidobacteriota bacterium]
MNRDFRVGSWLVQPQLNLITLDEQSHQIEPKVMEVLVYLAEHAGEVLSKDRIIQAVWADTFVTDEALWHCISELRRVFEDDPKNPRFIQTVTKKGYRLIAEVFWPEAETRYRLLERIGRGAMGEVHLAEDTLLRRKVALKFLLEDKEQEEKWTERLQREALAAAALDHPFICKVY